MKFQTPPGTYDVLPDKAAERDRLEQTAKKILEKAGYGRIETPTFESTELFARGVGEATDVVQKEMFTFEADSGTSYTLRPEGTAPVVRAYMEHGMHKLPQPVKLWYLSQLLPQRDAAGAAATGSSGRSGRRRSAPPEPAVDAEVILLLAEILEAIGVARRHARARDARPAGVPRGVPRGARRVPASRTRRSSAKRSSTASTSTRCAPSTPRTRARREVMAKAPRLIDRLPQEDLDHFAEVQDLLQAADLSYTVDTTLVRGLDYYTRTLFEFQSGAARRGPEHARRRRPLRRAGGGPRRPADARDRLGRGRRADADRRPRSRRRSNCPSTCSSPTRPSTRSRRSSSPPTRAEPATRQDSNSPGAA